MKCLHHAKTAKPCKRLVALLAVMALPLVAQAEGGSPWLPIPGQILLGVQLTTQSADSAFIGTMEVPVRNITGGAATAYKRATTSVRLNYGFSDALALEASVGHGRVKVGSADSDSGSTDATLGLAWRVLDEFASPGAPTVTLRALAIIKGSYDGLRLAAIGNEQNGVELALLVGKQFGGIGIWAEAGVQDRSGGVPNANFYEVGVKASFAGSLSASLSYANKKYGGDLDIGGPGFSPARFQQVRAERELVRASLGWGFSSNQGISLGWAQSLSGGRNTNKDDQIVSVSYTIGF